MQFSKKMLLVFGLIGACVCGHVSALNVSDLNNDTKTALKRAAMSTLVFGGVSPLLGTFVNKIVGNSGAAKLIGSIWISYERLSKHLNDIKLREKKLTELPDVGDEKLLTKCKKALAESGFSKADKLLIKVDQSEGLTSSYVYPSIFMGVPIIVMNTSAVQSTENSTALHEAGHLADVNNYSIKDLSNLLLVPLGLIWVVQPAAKKLTEYVCEPLLQKAFNGASSLAKHIPISKPLSIVKETVKLGSTLALVFGSCVGLEAFFAAWTRKNEKTADNFACKHLSKHSDFLMESRFYDFLSKKEKAFQSKHPVLSLINSWFASHPSCESRGENFRVHGENLKQLVKEQEQK